MRAVLGQQAVGPRAMAEASEVVEVRGREPARVLGAAQAVTGSLEAHRHGLDAGAVAAVERTLCEGERLLEAIVAEQQVAQGEREGLIGATAEREAAQVGGQRVIVAAEFEQGAGAGRTRPADVGDVGPARPQASSSAVQRPWPASASNSTSQASVRVRSRASTSRAIASARACAPSWTSMSASGVRAPRWPGWRARTPARTVQASAYSSP